MAVMVGAAAGAAKKIPCRPRLRLVHSRQDLPPLLPETSVMRIYEDRARRACNTPDMLGQCTFWQSGMEPNILIAPKPVSPAA